MKFTAGTAKINDLGGFWVLQHGISGKFWNFIA
jgi:hypothetical protein